MRVRLYRILGNDLPPRHEPGQTIENLLYQLEHEHEFEDVEKVWVLNRIVDSLDYKELKLALTSAGKEFLDIPFDRVEYLKQDSFEDKAAYITNNNPARNACLEDGFSKRADIVLPFDGNCFFTDESWYYARNSIINNFLSPYFIFPMARCQSYDDLSGMPQVKEMYNLGKLKRHDLTEPQIGFGVDHDLRFDERLRYSLGPKAELLVRIGVPGIWSLNWVDPKYRDRPNSRHQDRDPIYCGWVWRLPSGNFAAESDNTIRGRDRQQGISNIVKKADELISVKIPN